MTLILTINRRESIWLLADRRLSFSDRPPRDDARKVMFLETRDGVAILGYAGLGVTANGTEPADWMSAVLRSRNLPLERSLGILTEAVTKQIPRHIVGFSGVDGARHSIIVTAFLKDAVRLYTIDLATSPDKDKKEFKYRYTRHVRSLSSPHTPHIYVGGSGVSHLQRDSSWVRPLLRIVGAYERGKVTARAVSDQLAKLNMEVHHGTSDNTVGPRCIVAWRNRKDGRFNGGGGHSAYTNGAADAEIPLLPDIGDGMDIAAITDVMMPHMFKRFEAMWSGEESKDLDTDVMNRELACLPDKPDELLR